MAGSISLRALLLSAFASKAIASCAYGTLLQPRAEGGKVEVNTFGYTGKIVSTQKPTVIGDADNYRALPTGSLSTPRPTLSVLLA